MSAPRGYSKLALLAPLLGILLSLYAVYVEHKSHADHSYEALCDINATFSCSKVFSSEYGRLLSYWGLVEANSPLDRPNAEYGAILYTTMFLFMKVIRFSFSDDLLLLMSVFSLLSSVYLGYILYFVLKDACIVCISTYIVNICMFIAIVGRRRAVKNSSNSNNTNTNSSSSKGGKGY